MRRIILISINVFESLLVRCEKWSISDNFLEILDVKNGIDDLFWIDKRSVIPIAIAENSDLVCGVVGWVNFEDKNQLEQLKIFSNHPKFIGVRPMIQDIPDEWP